MLRNLVLALAAALTLAGAGLVAAGIPAFGLLLFGVLLLAGTAFERVRYKRLEPPPSPGRFAPTPERFIDDATGAAVTVWTDAVTGERKYVRD